MVKSNVTSRSNATANTRKKTHSAASSTSSKKKFVSRADSAAFAKHSDGQQCAGSKFFPQPLYDRMNQDLHLTGKADRTRTGYLRAVRKLTEYCQTSPDKITEDQLRQLLQFVEGFTQHVLPSGFRKVRYHGWMCSSSKTRLEEIRMLVWFALGWVC